MDLSSTDYRYTLPSEQDLQEMTIADLVNTALVLKGSVMPIQRVIGLIAIYINIKGGRGSLRNLAKALKTPYNTLRVWYYVAEKTKDLEIPNDLPYKTVRELAYMSETQRRQKAEELRNERNI